MTSGFSRYAEVGEQEKGSGWLKTYCIESELYRHDKNTPEALRVISEESGVEFEQTEDPSLSILKSNLRNMRGTLFVDSSDQRFWLIHTFGLSQKTDKLVKRITSNHGLDTAWFPMQFLNSLREKGEFKGYTGNFDNSIFEKNPDLASGIKMRLWGSRSEEVLDTFLKDERLKEFFSLSGIRIKSSNKDGFVIDELTYSGKTTALGTSLPQHLQFVNNIFRERYQSLIKDVIEKKYSLGVSENRLDGEPLFIKFKKIKLDLEQFTAAIFNGSTPFRLWAITEHVKNDYARVFAVDMHVGTKINFEVFEDMVRIYLPRGGCGNAISRFFTLFQQNYDTSAELVNGDDERIFK